MGSTNFTFYQQEIFTLLLQHQCTYMETQLDMADEREVGTTEK